MAACLFFRQPMRGRCHPNGAQHCARTIALRGAALLRPASRRRPPSPNSPIIRSKLSCRDRPAIWKIWSKDDLGSAAKGPRCSLRGDNMKGGGGVIAASHPANWPRWSHAGHVHRQHPDLADPQRPRPIWPPHLLIDSAEIKGEGEGETLEVRAVELTSSDIGDALTLPNCKAKSDQISTSPQSPPTAPTARASAMMLSPNED